MNRANSILVAYIILMFLTHTVSATAQYEAENYYNSAKQFLSEDDWENALRSVERSKEIYTELEDDKGISKCNDFITDNLESILTKEQMAGMYFNIAGDYFLEAGDEDLEDYERTEYLARTCKERYQEISGPEGTTGVLKCEDLLKQATTRVVAIKTSQKEFARFYYEMAQTSYRNKNYIEAREYLINSSTIYHSIPDPSGIAKTAALLTSIQDVIDNIKTNAAVSYKEALDYMVNGNYDQAREYAIAAQTLYTNVQDEEGEIKSSALLSQINQKIGLDREQRLKNARSLFIQSQEYYTLQEYVNASMAANAAKEIYTEFYNEAFIKEEHLTPNKRVETMLYNGYVSEVNKLLAQIAQDWGDDRMLEQAEILYGKSQEFFAANRLDEALAYARNAQNMYSDLEYYIGISKTNSLITMISGRMAKIQEANRIYDDAIQYYSVADFENAYITASQAKEIYSDAWKTDKVAEIELFLENVNNGRALKAQGDNYFGEAKGHFNALNYKEALDFAKKSNNAYQKINYTLGVTESRKLIDESERILDEEWTNLRNTIIVVALIGVVILFVLVSWKQKSKAIEVAFEQKSREDEDKRRRDKEEWGLEKEVETKTMVEDELRRLIQEERQVGDDRGQE